MTHCIRKNPHSWKSCSLAWWVADPRPKVWMGHRPRFSVLKYFAVWDGSLKMLRLLPTQGCHLAGAVIGLHGSEFQKGGQNDYINHRWQLCKDEMYRVWKLNKLQLLHTDTFLETLAGYLVNSPFSVPSFHGGWGVVVRDFMVRFLSFWGMLLPPVTRSSLINRCVHRREMATITKSKDAKPKSHYFETLKQWMSWNERKPKNHYRLRTPITQPLTPFPPPIISSISDNYIL